jgi:chromosome segregation ATPase
VLEFAQKIDEEARELLILSRSNKIFTKRFAKYRQNNGGGCPCCGQSMNATTEKVYEAKVKELFSVSVDEDEASSLEEHKAASTSCATLLARVKELHTALRPLQEIQSDMASIDAQIKELSSSSAQQRKALSAAETASKEVERSSSSLVKLVRDLTEANQRWHAVNKRSSEFLEKKRRQSQSLMSVDLGNRSFEDLESAQRRNADAKDELQARKDRLVAEEASLTKRFYTLKTLLSESEKAYSEAKGDGARYAELEAAVTKLQERIGEVEERKAAIGRERDQVVREAAEKQAVLGSLKGSLAQEEARANATYAAIKEDRDGFVKIAESLESVEQRTQELNLAEVAAALEAVHQTVQAKEEEIKELNKSISASTAELASQEHTRRNMQANLEWRAFTAELNNLREQLQSMLQQQQQQQRGPAGAGAGGGGDHATRTREAERDLQRAQRQHQTHVSAKDTLRGKLEIYAVQAAELRSKLTLPSYKNIDQRHRMKCIEHETTLLAITDLESYYNAL